jgi:hypothetical protein
MDEIWLDSTNKWLTGLRCPKCKRLVDGATGASFEDRHPEPSPNSIGICIFCGSWNRYVHDPTSSHGLKLRLATKEEMNAARRDPRMARLFDAMEDAATKYRRQWQ